MISEIEIELIEDHLFAKELSDQALDYFGFHGLVTAAAVSPSTPDIKTLWTTALGYDTEQPVKCPEKVCKIIEKILTETKNTVIREEAFSLPFESEEEEEAIFNWCTGFVEGHLINEDEWFGKNEEVVAELLLPILTLSDFSEDLDIDELKSSDKIMAEMIDQIPEVITDLYLLYHSK